MATTGAHVHYGKEDKLKVEVTEWNTVVNGNYFSVSIDGITLFLSPDQFGELKTGLFQKPRVKSDH